MKRIIALVFTATLLLTGCNNVGDNSSLQVSADTTSQELMNGDITEYPEDNIFGLKSVREEDNGNSKTITFTFKHLKEENVNSSILRDNTSISGLSPYGYFNFDEQQTADRGDYFDVILTCDSRITLINVLFDYDDERCIVNFKDRLELRYCDFNDKTLTKFLNQNYNFENMSWDKSYKEEIPVPETDGIEYSIYTIKEIDYDDESEIPVKTFGDLTFKATEYNYTADKYNIYGEIDTPALTTLRFDLIDKKNPIEITISESDIRLYKKTEEKYTEITPTDISLTLRPYNNDKNLEISITSNTLGDLQEGDYRVECCEYYVDFVIAVHTKEVW